MKFFIVTEAGVSCDPALFGNQNLDADSLSDGLRELSSGWKKRPTPYAVQQGVIGEDPLMVLVNINPEGGTVCRIAPGFNRARGVHQIWKGRVPTSTGSRSSCHPAWLCRFEPGAVLEIEIAQGRTGPVTRLLAIAATHKGEIEFHQVALPSEPDGLEEPGNVGAQTQRELGEGAVRVELGDSSQPLCAVCSAEPDELKTASGVTLLCFHE